MTSGRRRGDGRPPTRGLTAQRAAISFSGLDITTYDHLFCKLL